MQSSRCRKNHQECSVFVSGGHRLCAFRFPFGYRAKKTFVVTLRSDAGEEVMYVEYSMSVMCTGGDVITANELLLSIVITDDDVRNGNRLGIEQ